MISVTPHSEGCVIPVRAAPGARRTGIVGEQAGALKISVTAPALENRANEAILELLRETLGLKRSQLTLLSGEKSRNKKVLCRGVSTTEILARIEVLLH